MRTLSVSEKKVVDRKSGKARMHLVVFGTVVLVWTHILQIYVHTVRRYRNKYKCMYVRISIHTHIS